jgi:hypothetical protein
MLKMRSAVSAFRDRPFMICCASGVSVKPPPSSLINACVESRANASTSLVSEGMVSLINSTAAMISTRSAGRRLDESAVASSRMASVS